MSRERPLSRLNGAFEQGDGFDVVGLGEEVEGDHPLQFIAALDEALQIAGERAGVTRA
jgi:hypothetical protein